MALVIEKPVAAYDLTQIKAGYLFYGRHRTWDEGKSGIVTSVTEKQLTVQYYPGIANVTNHFVIPAEEIIAGEWEVRWSADMSGISEIKADSQEDAGQEETEVRDESA